MPSTGSTSIQSVLRYPLIAGRVSRLGPVGQVLTNFYGVGLKNRNGVVQGGTKRSDNRDIVYDVFDTSRLTSSVRSPGTGPARRQRDPIGKVSTVGLRVFEVMDFLYEDLRNLRPQGGKIGTVDEMGKRYIADQTDNMIRRDFNTREFVFSRMLKGSLDLLKVGDEYRPVVSGGDITVDFKIPASHKSQLGLNTGGADIIDASWATSSTDILKHLMNIYSASIRETGMPATEVWMNSNMWVHIMNNDAIQDQGGSSFRTWESQNRNQVESAKAMDPNIPLPYFTYQLRATGMQFNFHVYDGGLNLNATENSTDFDDWTPFIGDNELIITPSPQYTQWFDMWEISEVVKERYDDAPKNVYGFHAWGMEEFNNGVPKHAFYMLDNFAPALPVPKAVYNPTVVF